MGKHVLPSAKVDVPVENIRLLVTHSTTKKVSLNTMRLLEMFQTQSLVSVLSEDRA